MRERLEGLALFLYELMMPIYVICLMLMGGGLMLFVLFYLLKQGVNFLWN